MKGNHSNIYLIGFMGAGKTTVGQKLAIRLNRPFVDLDKVIEGEVNLTIPMIFEEYGQKFFRKLETKCLTRISQTPKSVIATGGGIILSPQNRNIMKKTGITIYLSWPANILYHRIKKSLHRPLLTGMNRNELFQYIEELINERRPFYEQADYTIYGNEKTTAEETVDMILQKLPPELIVKILNLNLGDRTYPILIDANSLSHSAKEILRHCDAKTFVIISDENVAVHYSEKLRNSLQQNGLRCRLYKIAPGEESKSLTTAEQIYTWMLANRFHRDDVIIALGGGVVGDLAGFIAATYLRGIRWIQIPTTLMAQVDSSVGGKVAVNHPLAKNSIGAFYQPQLVWIDPITLKTLPKRELYNGLAEVIKYGLILDQDLFEFLEINFSDILALENFALLIHIIRTCCRLKAKVVEKDERESNHRRILNFGHTVGHALERITEYHYFRHGEAVAWGMLAAATISQRKIGFSIEQLRRVVEIIKLLERPPLPSEIKTGQILQAIETDKKMTVEGLQFVLLEDIGSCKIELVDRELMEYGINKMRSYNKILNETASR